MDLQQLKTFVVVAREGSITRASERLYLSQPAVSAHIKALEDELALTLFERTPRGMVLTSDGQRMLAKAEQTLRAQQDLLEEATRIKGRLSGRLRLGAAFSVSAKVIGEMVAVIAEQLPDVEIALSHGTSAETLDGIRRGSFDAALYNEAGEPHPDLAIVEATRVPIYLAAAPGLLAPSASPDWTALARVPWICPTASTCCGRAAENLFAQHRMRPERILNVDRESVTRTLVAGKVGVGLLHGDTAEEARANGEVEIVCEAQSVRTLFVHLAGRVHDPLLSSLSALVRART